MKNFKDLPGGLFLLQSLVNACDKYLVKGEVNNPFYAMKFKIPVFI